MVAHNDRFSRRTFAALGLGASAGLIAATRSVTAQDASPTASPEVAEVGGFENTGFTEIVVAAEQLTFNASIPGAMGEGWYTFTLVNETESVADLNLGLLPEGTTGSDLSSTLATAFQGEGGELPEWWSSAMFAGGAVAGPGESTSSLVYLTPGKWYMFSANPASTQSPASFLIQTAEELEANYGIVATPTASPVGVATPGATPEIAGLVNPEGVTAAVSIEVTENQIVPNGAPTGGQQVLQITNAGDQVRDIIILQTEETLDEAGAVALATSWIRGEETNATVAGGVGALSPGWTAFTEVDVQPGNYVVFSAMPDANGGLQVENGIIATFSGQ